MAIGEPFGPVGESVIATSDESAVKVAGNIDQSIYRVKIEE